MFRFVSRSASTGLVSALWLSRTPTRHISFHSTPLRLHANPDTSKQEFVPEDAVKPPSTPTTTTQNPAAGGTTPQCPYCHAHAHAHSYGHCHGGGGGIGFFFARVFGFFMCFAFFIWFMRLLFGCPWERRWEREVNCRAAPQEVRRDDEGERRGPWGGRGPWGRGPWGGGRFRHDVPWWAPTNAAAAFLVMRAVLPEAELERVRGEYEQACKGNAALTLGSFLAKQHPHLLDGEKATQAQAVAAVEACLRVVKSSEVRHTIHHAARSARDGRAAIDAIVASLEKEYPAAFKQ